MINAYVQKARNFQLGEGNNYELREMLRELEEDRENRPFLDKISGILDPRTKSIARSAQIVKILSLLQQMISNRS